MSDAMVVTGDVAEAHALDADDELASFRDRFEIPHSAAGDPLVYFAGNSLGLQPKTVRTLLLAELDKWAECGVRGHFEGERPWAPFHEFVAGPMANIVGAEVDEVVTMNALTVNLHLMMQSFYRPTADRHKVLIEDHAFPSDHFAVESQVRSRGFDPATSVVTVAPRPGEESIRPDDLRQAIESNADELALLMLPGVQYYTGQVFPMRDVVAWGHAAGATVGLDLAHAVGNVPLALHEWGPDFAVWCTYKYLNAGPGATGGAFVHRRHLGNGVPRLEGWWGHDKETRFHMENTFVPIPTAEAWQLSNAPVFSMAPLIASLEVFADAGGMGPLREKAEKMIRYLDALLDSQLAGRVTRVTPAPLTERGCQLSLRVEAGKGPDVFAALQQADIECDWRYPDVIRVAPVPLYNTFTDIHRFVDIMSGILR